ncbi:hypothetical protein PLESTB_000761600 [Pleodorina starrii]|uniref:Protein kinase domain-containing protein n=1 Tax=Pleodorina starrii TaxID=330485 RepID=A0A9W6F281_9CHLO|nr:hypothetical protein PLESTM_001577500 [Pleodorina starrii]GLC53549.1 hypothetical protein PLESTB_000761600 [Pleodorina starrii]
MKVTLCWRPDPNTACEIQAVEEFRSKIVAYTGTWPAFWNAHAANVLDTCEGAAALVSVLGASQAGSTLTVLGSWGPDAAALYMGRIMPSPWGRMAVTNPNTKPSADASAAQTGAHGPKALTWKSGSPISLPYEWHQLLGQTRFAETLSLHAVLEPLLLGGRLVGALLVVTYGGRMPHSKATREALPCNGSGLAAAPFTSPVTWTGGAGAGAGGGGGERGAGESSPESAFASVASSILHRLKKRAGSGRSSPSSAPSPGLLRGLGAALSQAAFAPHLQAVVRLCSACQSLATATTLAGLSSIISATVSEALAAELHVSLAVRVAVVPPMHGQYGYLLPAWGESGLGLGSAFFNGDSPVKRAASSILPNCAAAASSARALRPAGRGNSFSGQAPASASNAIVSSPGGFLAKADSAKVLLPACLSSLSMGPVRAEVDRLPAPGGGGNNTVFSTRRILAATSSIPGGGGGGGTSVATPSASASATPLPSTHISGSHVQLSQLQLQMQQAAARASRDRDNPSPRKGAGAAEAGAAAPAPALPSPLRDGGGAAAGLASNPGGVAAAAAAAGGTAQRGGKGPRDGSDGEGGGHLIPVVMGSSRDICLITQQRWPEGGSATQMGTGSGVGLGTSPCCAPPAASSLVPTAPSSQSRTTRGSPGSYVFGVSGCGEDGALGLGTGTGLLASMDVTGAMDDMVTSMRHNLDVWVASFWEMLRDNTAHAKGGHTPGSYADDDLRFLRIYQQLGSGGAASVYAGVLLGMDVAVKVIEPPPEVDMEALAGSQAPPREAEEEGGPAGDAEEAEGEGERMASLAAAVRQAQMRELVRSARECAVLTTLSHPAIVQVYSFHTRVQVVPGEGPDRLPRLVPVPPGEGGEAQGPLHSVLIMERCDLGSLADALDNGMFKKAIIAAAQAAPAPASNSARPAAAGARPSNGQVSGGGGGNGGFSFSSVGSVSGGGIGGGAAMRAIYLTLLEVALALRHLHSMNLVHCDVKVANVLLKSSASDPRGFTCKLSDFGLINLLRDHEGEEGEGEERKGQEGAEATDEAEAGRESDPQAVRGAAEAVTTSPSTHRKLWMRNADAAGTVTHLAPECFQPGSKLDQSVDIYAFGIVMWEVFTRKPPYAEFAPEFEGLAARVLAGLRPRFPSHCPPAYRALAQACWCRDAARRPTAASVVNCLQQMLEGPL